jgi:EAL domain-containing protein (putative c-di-GMP-specific phosphodiesterase class I)
MECGVSVIADRSEAASLEQGQLLDPPDGRRVKLAAQRIEAGEQRRIAAHLASAMEAGALQLKLQPRIALASGAVIGAEARLAMPHRRRGIIPLDDMVKSLGGKSLASKSLTAYPAGQAASPGIASPGATLPAASAGSAQARFGLIERINDYLLHEACKTAKNWPSGWSIAVNIGAHYAGTAQFAAAVERELAAWRLPPQRLDFEIAEAELVEGGAVLRETLGGLQGLHTGLVLDEFGQAYASLSLLRRLKLTAVKLDRGLTRGLATSAADRALLCAAVEIGHGTGMKIIADGVETQEQFDCLRAMGCDQAQGPWFSQAMPG